MSNSVIGDINILSGHVPDKKFIIFSSNIGKLYVGDCNSFGKVVTLYSFRDCGVDTLLDSCIELKKGNRISGNIPIVPTNEHLKKKYTVIGDEAGLYYELMDDMNTDRFTNVRYEDKIELIWGLTIADYNNSMDMQEAKKLFSKNLSIEVTKDENGDDNFTIDIIKTITKKVQRHCGDLNLCFKRTVLCGKLMVFISGYNMTFHEVEPVVLKTPHEVELYEIRLMDVIEKHLKSCFESIVVL